MAHVRVAGAGCGCRVTDMGSASLWSLMALVGFVRLRGRRK
ncbi:MAG: MYXO-CTERM sorting domain-containing protein [Myxococcaceae bacterium]